MKKISKKQEMILAVDLDGTLINTDILYESFLSSLSRDWKTIFILFLALFKGKPFLKKKLLQKSDIDVTLLPYNDEVIEYIKNKRSKDFKVVLVTASHQIFADKVSKHLNLFDYTFGTNNQTNLKGKAKAKFLIDKFGKNFFYIGNSKSDFEIWKISKKAISFNLSYSLRKKLENINSNYKHLNFSKIDFFSFLKAMRPQQWIKNILLFLPIIASHQYDNNFILKTIVAFIAFCLMSSSVYLVNDLLDLSEDRKHKHKKNRPFASGAISILSGSLLMLFLLFISLVISASLGLKFLCIIFIYFSIASAYSLFLKQIIVLDMCVLAILYTIRVLAGGFATNIEVSTWLIALSIFIFFSLASIKRQTEIIATNSIKGKINLRRGYIKEDLPLITIMGISSGYVSILVMALYIDSIKVESLYSTPNFLWGVCFILLFWISRLAIITHRGLMHHDPVAFAVKDKVSFICLICILLLVFAGKTLDI